MEQRIRSAVELKGLEPETPAVNLDGHLPEPVKAERRDALMALQQPIAFAFNRGLVGRALDVLIDAPATEGRHLWLGRTYADAPDVDSVTWVRGSNLGPETWSPARSSAPRTTT